MIFFLSSRFAFSRTSHHRSNVIRIMLTTALSLSVVVVVISIMTYLQESRFSRIRAVRSFDIVVDGAFKDEIDPILSDATVFEYGEWEALIGSKAFLVRYIDDEYKGGIRYLMGDGDSLVLPYSLYLQDRKSVYDISILAKGRSGVVLPKTMQVPVSGVYSSLMGSEFDSSYIFMPLSSAPGNIEMKTAIIGVDLKAKRHLEELGYSVVTWKDAESSLYSAFIIEKTLMYVILALLFVLIGVSTKQSIRIFYRSKRKERIELQILGLQGRKVNLAFVLSYFLIFLISIIASAIISFILLNIVEYLSVYVMIVDMNLEFPFSGFIFFSLFLLLVTVLFSLYEIRKDSKTELVEVLNER